MGPLPNIIGDANLRIIGVLGKACQVSDTDICDTVMPGGVAYADIVDV